MTLNWLCNDCGENCILEYYMLHNSLWLKVMHVKVPSSKNLNKHEGLSAIRMLCIGCVEHRLGRLLTPKDFTAAPINSTFEKSPRLWNRLGKSEEGLEISLRSNENSAEV